MGRVRLVVVLGRGSASPLRPWLVGSLVAHLAGAGLILVSPAFRSGPLIPVDAVMVELVGGLPGPPAPPAAGGAPAPAEPEPPPEEGVTVSEPEPEPPKRLPEPKKPEPKPEKKPDKKKEDAPKAAPAESGAAGTGSGAGPGAPSGESSGSAEAGGSVSAMIGGDAAFGWYRASVTNALFLSWRRPVLTDLRAPLEVQVEFTILRSGEVRDARVAVSSGVPSLDRSALRAVAEASPLPALPAAWRSPALPASFVFRLYPEGA